MTFQHKPNRGSLFRNDRKQKDSEPDYKGDALIDGKEVWLSAWLNDGKNGKYLSLSFQDKQESHDRGMAQTRQDAGMQEAPSQFEDDIPF